MQIIVVILIVLLTISVYFSARFFLLSKNIKEVTKDLKEICGDIESNRKLIFISPNKNFESLLIEVNKYLEKTQLEKIKHVKVEKEIRKEIENISHDLRTPLTSIRGYLELIKDESSTSEEKHEYINIIDKKSKNLQNLIQTFYDLSMLEAKEYKLQIETIDINKMLREQLLDFYNEFDKRAINVDIDLGQEAINVQGDVNALYRIFTNMIQNSIKYSKTTFKAYLEKNDNEAIVIFVNDTNELNEEDIQNLFKRFYMKDTSRNSQSSGLGLTITKLLVEAIGGRFK